MSTSLGPAVATVAEAMLGVTDIGVLPAGREGRFGGFDGAPDGVGGRVEWNEVTL